MRVLLIDDDETNSRFLVALLTKVLHRAASFEVERAGRLFDGLRRIEEAPAHFDAILLDLGLPECGGLTTLQLVLAQAPTIPVVVVTGLDSREVEADAIRAGAEGFLVKGRFDSERLGRALIAATVRPRDPREEPGPGDTGGTFRYREDD